MSDNRPAEGDRQAVWLLSAMGGLIGGLCCLTPIVMVLLGLATVSVASDIGNLLYGEYKWAFRFAGLLFLAAALVIYFRRQGVCTLDEARRQRNRLINTSLVVLFSASAIYVFWTYVVLHYWGIAAGLPWAQYDESWAVPASVVMLGVAVLASWWRLRR